MKKLSLGVLFLTVSFLVHTASAQPHTGHAAVHGMLMFGAEKIFISHLPLFHAPHDYQVILEVEVPQEKKALYLKAVEQNPQSIFTVVPKPFVLATANSLPAQIQGDIFLGHFEKGGKLLLSQVLLKIKKNILFQKLNPESSAGNLKYLLFGSATEKFLAHIIGAKPSFDHIVKVDEVEADPSSAQGAQTVVTFQAPDKLPLDPSQNIQGANEQGKPVILKKMKDVYLETEELSF